MVLLHASLVFTQLIRSETRVMEIVSDVFSYASYYSLSSCLLWLYVLCDNVWQSLFFYYRSTPDNAYDELLQTLHESERMPRLLCYKILGFTIPLCGTVVVMLISKLILKSNGFPWNAYDVRIATNEFFFVYFPMILCLTFGVIQFAYTGHLIYKMERKDTEWRTQKRIDLEKKR